MILFALLHLSHIDCDNFHYQKKETNVKIFTNESIRIFAYFHFRTKLQENIMDNNLRAEITQLHAQVCSGLSDPTRILILYKVAENPINVSDLAIALEIPQPTVSRHLKVLRDRRMVVSQREGQSVFYSLADERIIQALDLLRAVLSSSLENQAALVRQASESA
jgi:DNA-binding transcriptional ArsR family regulator